MKYKVHKVFSERFFDTQTNTDKKQYSPPLCRTVGMKFGVDASVRWDRVTCKNCLKMRKKNGN